MSVLPLLCWLALAVPGAAAVRRFVPSAWGGGILSMLGIGWMATFAMLAPVVVLGYLLRLPVGPIAVLTLGMVVIGAVDLLRGIDWRRAHAALPPAMILAAAIVLADVVMAERIGAILDNDARVHLARIRFVLDHGLSNVDPFVRAPIEHPYPLYHTNLLHALHAMIAWITGLDPLDAWFGSLGASRLMVAAAGAWAAWALVGGRWAPWIAAIVVLLARIGIDYMPYPNQLAPWFAVPMALGITALVLGHDARPLVGTSACALTNLVVAMVHPLYAGFLLVMLGPVLLSIAMVRSVRRIGRPVVPLACILGFALSAVPMLVAVRAMTAGPGRGADVASASAWERAQSVDDAASQASLRPGAGTPDALGRARTLAIHRQDGFTMSARDGRLMISRDWGRGFTGGWGGLRGWRLWTALAATVLALGGLGRPQAMVALGAIAVVLGVMSVPVLCTGAIGFLGAQWMILRFEALAGVAWCLLAVPVGAALLERWSGGRRTLAFVAGAGVTALAVWIGLGNDGVKATEKLERWRDRASASAGTRSGAAFDGLVGNREWLERVMPKDAVVACGRLTGTWAAMLRGPRLVCSERSSTGVTSGATRTRHVAELLDDATDEDRRAELLHHYGITHVLIGGRNPAWLDYWADRVDEGEGHWLTRLRDRPDPTKGWERAVADANRDVLHGCAERAEPELVRLVDERPDAWRGWYALGNAQWSLAQHAQAQRSYEEALRRAPEEPMPALMLGNCAESLGDPIEAISWFEAAETLAVAGLERTVAASSNFNRANVLRRLGRLDEAESAYRRAVGFDPSHRRAREELGRAPAWLMPAPDDGDGATADDGPQDGDDGP